MLLPCRREQSRARARIIESLFKGLHESHDAPISSCRPSSLRKLLIRDSYAICEISVRDNTSEHDEVIGLKSQITRRIDVGEPENE